MVIAGDDVTDSEFDEIEPAGRDRAIHSYRNLARSLLERDLLLATGRPDIAERLIVLTQKGAPILGNLEATVGRITREVDVDGPASAGSPGAANAHRAHPATRAA